MSHSMPDKPIDFLGEEISVGDIIVYPTGGPSCRMVNARVVAINDRIKSFKLAHRYDGEPFWQGPHNGVLGPARFRLAVKRLQEGNRLMGETDRIVCIDQLHRVVDLDQI